MRGGNDIVFCLVGPSGAGKTTMAQLFEQDGYNVIQSYTTRPPRSESEWGHIFVDQYEPHTGIVAYNCFNEHHYWATRDQFQGKGPTIYVVDPPGVEGLRASLGLPIVVLFMRIGRSTAYWRLRSSRGRKAAIARVEHDYDVFSCVQTDWVIDAELPIEQVYGKCKEIAEMGELGDAKSGLWEKVS